LQTPRCMRDPFSAGLFERYSTKEDLSGPECKAILATVGEFAKLDTASIECGHSLWQREARCRSLQTVATSQSSTSAAFTMTKQRPVQFV
jgi:hypothetical protein